MQSDQSLCQSLEYSMTVKLLTEHHLEFLILKKAAQARLSLHLSNATLMEITCRGSIINNIREKNLNYRHSLMYTSLMW